MERFKMGDAENRDHILIFNLAKYTIKNGPVLSGGIGALPLEQNLVSVRTQIKVYFQEVITLLLNTGELSGTTRQVLSNVSMKLTDDAFFEDDAYEYVSSWMEKIALRQALLPDEKLVIQIFNSDIYLTDLNITKIAEKITGISDR
jgi:hypothetical protein